MKLLTVSGTNKKNRKTEISDRILECNNLITNNTISNNMETRSMKRKLDSVSEHGHEQESTKKVLRVDIDNVPVGGWFNTSLRIRIPVNNEEEEEEEEENEKEEEEEEKYKYEEEYLPSSPAHTPFGYNPAVSPAVFPAVPNNVLVSPTGTAVSKHYPPSPVRTGQVCDPTIGYGRVYGRGYERGCGCGCDDGDCDDEYGYEDGGDAAAADDRAAAADTAYRADARAAAADAAYRADADAAADAAATAVGGGAPYYLYNPTDLYDPFKLVA